MGFTPCMLADWLITLVNRFHTALFTIPHKTLVCNWSKLSHNTFKCTYQAFKLVALLENVFTLQEAQNDTFGKS